MLHDLLRVRMSWPLRLVLVGAAVLLLGAFFLPIWGITLYSNQYPDGLRVAVHAGHFEAGENGTDLTEINTLNHYIGMRPLNQADIPELKWIGVALGAFAALAVAAAVAGRAVNVALLLATFAAFGGVSFWLFYSRLYEYGHTLDPRAAVTVPPFTPPLFGTAQLANFTVESYPDTGTFLMLAFGAALVVVVALAWRTGHMRRRLA